MFRNLFFLQILAIEDILFLMRNSPVKIQRLVKYLKTKVDKIAKNRLVLAVFRIRINFLRMRRIQRLRLETNTDPGL
jgi:hypothetical protein